MSSKFVHEIYISEKIRIEWYYANQMIIKIIEMQLYIFDELMKSSSHPIKSMT